MYAISIEIVLINIGNCICIVISERLFGNYSPTFTGLTDTEVAKYHSRVCVHNFSRCIYLVFSGKKSFGNAHPTYSYTHREIFRTEIILVWKMLI